MTDVTDLQAKPADPRPPSPADLAQRPARVEVEPRTVTGAQSLVLALEAAGVMPEPMNSPSAARSYNVTLSEGRRVACALLPL